MMIRVCLIGGVRLTREGLDALVSRDERFEVVARIGPGDETEAAESLADVAVVDASTTALQAIQQIVEEGRAPTLVLAPPDDEARVIALAQMGVMGFIEREACIDEFFAAIAAAARREATFPPRIGTALLRHISSPRVEQDGDGTAVLTLREREVIRLVAAGLSNKEIGARLCIELATVKNHVHNILRKLRVSDRAAAVDRLGMGNGLPREQEI